MPKPENQTLRFRFANLSDAAWLAEWNLQLIRDEGHRNLMTVPQLELRLRKWLSGAYQAVIFERDDYAVAYALYRQSGEVVHLRHFFVHREQRHKGVGREAMRVLMNQVWPRRHRVLVEVLIDNRPAREFCQALGFKERSITMEIMPEDRAR
jgi:GNAT superfamily N-acetyltransferase